jgi:hypothetical protein
MDYADIYYIDPRNADNRTPPMAGRWPLRPVTQFPPAALPPAALPPAAPVGLMPAGYPQPTYSQPVYPTGYPFPTYGNPPWGTNPLVGNLSAIVGGFGGLGSLADVIAQIFASVLPMPSAPTPLGADQGDTNTSVDTMANTKNLITYQAALASYAKRDEQIRTIGSLLKKLVG